MGRIKKVVYGNRLLNHNGTITPRPCTNSCLARIYGVERKTLLRWLKPFQHLLEREDTYLYTRDQVSKIFEKLGPPQDYEVTEYVLKN